MTTRRRREFHSDYPSPLNVRVSDDDRLALDLLAELEGTTLSDLVRRILRSALDESGVDRVAATG